MNIVDALRTVGFDVPDGCLRVTIDSEEMPTRIMFECAPSGTDDLHRRIKRDPLSETERALLLEAIQLHRVRHRLQGGKVKW